METMSWQDKLHVLIEANKQGKFPDWSLLLYSEPLDPERIDAILWRLRDGFKIIRVASPAIVERGKEDGRFGAEAWP